MPEPAEIKTDSSTGLAQIFAATAIKALNNAHDRGFNQLDEKYDVTDWRDVAEVWNNLNTNDTYNIMCCALVILDCQYEYQSIVPYSEFFDFSETQAKRVISRYNGTGDNGMGYAEITYEYFEVFKDYNE